MRRGPTAARVAGLRSRRIQLDEYIVVRAQRVLDRAGRLRREKTIDRLLRRNQTRRHGLLERRGVGQAGPERNARGADRRGHRRREAPRRLCVNAGCARHQKGECEDAN